MARRKKLENTSLEEQLEYVEQEIRIKESDLKELRHKAKEIRKKIEENHNIFWLRSKPVESRSPGFRN